MSEKLYSHPHTSWRPLVAVRNNGYNNYSDGYNIIITKIIIVVAYDHTCVFREGRCGHADNPLEWDADDCRESGWISKCSSSAAGRSNISAMHVIIVRHGATTRVPGQTSKRILLFYILSKNEYLFFYNYMYNCR